MTLRVWRTCPFGDVISTAEAVEHLRDLFFGGTCRKKDSVAVVVAAGIAIG